MQERLANPASVFSPRISQPLTAGPNDDRAGEAEDNGDALTVPSFGSSASIADSGGSGARWNLADTAVVCMSEWVTAQTTMDDMPELRNGGCWFGGGSGLMANARGCWN